MKKILFAIPTLDGKISMDLFNFLDTVTIPRGFTRSISYTERTLIDDARNGLVKRAIDGGFDYIFFIDDDTIPEKNVLENMLSSDLPIVTGIYRARGGDKKLMLWEKTMIGDNPHYHNINKINTAIGVIQSVDACGAGCLLIKTSVLKDMVKEYGPRLFEKFTMPFYKGREYRFDKKVDPKDIRFYSLSEDIIFCERARALMYRIHADTRCLCKHGVNGNYVYVDAAMFSKCSDPEISVLIKEKNFKKMQKMLLDKMRLNYEVVFVDSDITQETIKSCNSDIVIYLDDVEIPYGLDMAMVMSLDETTITGPMTLIDDKPNFRNDNIVTHCWAMRKEHLEKIVPVPTKIKDFTIHRKIKENKWVCAILDAMIKFNG